MIDFKVNGKKVKIASSWEDLTYEQFYESFNLTGDILKRVSFASGLDYELLKNADISGLEAVIEATHFLNTPAQWDKPVLQCGKYSLPINHKGKYNIQFESLAQFEDLRVIVLGLQGKGVKEIAESYPKMVAIYLQKIRDKAYEPNKATEMIAEVRLMPAREVVTLGSFFMIKVLSLLTGIQPNSQKQPENPKKRKPVSASSKKPSGRSPRSRK